MTFTLILEQAFNGLQAGVTLFLVAAGLTLFVHHGCCFFGMVHR